MADALIRTQRLTKSYGKTRGIVDLDLEVRPGEVFGYLGPNGAGKTTTIRLLLDLIRPTTGSAEVFGLDPHRDGLAVRQRVGYLPGELRLYGSLSAKELFAYFGHLRKRPDGADAARIAAALDLDMDREIRNLSHGNRQKVGLVQALMGRPELVILDEPTQGLAEEEIASFCALVREIAREATVLLIEHNMAVVMELAHRITVMNNGAVLAEGTPAEIRADARVQEAYLGT